MELNKLNLSGEIVSIGDTEAFGSGDFTKRTVVIETPDERYPQQIPVEFHKDNTAKLDNFSVGQTVVLEEVNVRGKEYNGRYFINIVGWKISASEGEPEMAEDDIQF